MTLLLRSGKPPLSIEGECILEWSGFHFCGSQQNRHYVVQLFQQEGGSYALGVLFTTQWQGETDYHWAFAGTPAEIVEWTATLGDPPVPPVWGYPPSPAYEDRQQRLVASLRAQWHAALLEVFNREAFAVPH